ncbi:MAG: hypothetical protein ACI81R_002567 [Bradymonadia bacterium]|jgi:hypothetical protein
MTILAVLLSLSIGLLIAVFAARLGTRSERRFVAFGIVAHGGAGIMQLLILRFIYGNDGDMDTYFRFGGRLAELIASAPATVLPATILTFLQLPAELPMDLPGAGLSAHSMYSLAALFSFVFQGSRLAITLTLSWFSFFNKWLIYLVLSRSLPARLRPRLAFGVLLFPSAVFWSCGLLKETVAFCGFGFLFYGTWLLLKGSSRALGVALVVFGSIPVLIVKPYIMIPAGMAVVAWIYTQHRPASDVRIPITPKRVFMTLLGIAAVFLIIRVVGEIAPRFAIENIVDSTTSIQTAGQNHARSTTMYRIVDPNAGVAGQIAAAPLALLTAMYRPLPFEATSALVFINSLETFSLLMLTVVVIRRRGVVGSWRAIRGSPALSYAFAFVVIFGVAVGLGSTNLGSLSRYRMPMIPFFAALLLCLSSRPPVARRAQPSPRRRRTQMKVVSSPANARRGTAT